MYQCTEPMCARTARLVLVLTSPVSIDRSHGKFDVLGAHGFLGARHPLLGSPPYGDSFAYVAYALEVGWRVLWPRLWRCRRHWRWRRHLVSVRVRVSVGLETLFECGDLLLERLDLLLPLLEALRQGAPGRAAPQRETGGGEKRLQMC